MYIVYFGFDEASQNFIEFNWRKTCSRAKKINAYEVVPSGTGRPKTPDEIILRAILYRLRQGGTWRALSIFAPHIATDITSKISFNELKNIELSRVDLKNSRTDFWLRSNSRNSHLVTILGLFEHTLISSANWRLPVWRKATCWTIPTYSFTKSRNARSSPCVANRLRSFSPKSAIL